MVLVVLVIFLFLRNLPATLIPSLSVPLSLVGTLAAMYLLGFSLDNLSLMALTISTGFVVDDAIVMIENIARHVEDGDAPLEAALKGSEEIGFTIISLTVSLIAVLIPLLFMGDVVGRLFNEFAVTLSVTIVLSAVVSLTLVPMMCALLVRHRPAERRNRLDLAAERGFDRLIAGYGRWLNWVLDHQALTLLVAVLTLAATVVMYVVIPKGFFPVQDTGAIQGISEAAQDTSFAAMAAHQQALADVILKDPAVDSLSSFIGVDGTNTTLNAGRLLINLKPKDDRDLDVDRGDRPAAATKSRSVPGITLSMQPVQDLTIDSTVSRGAVPVLPGEPRQQPVRDSGCRSWWPSCRRRPAFSAVTSDMNMNGRALDMVIDRADRGALRHHAGDHRQRALRRVRPAHRLDALHPVQPVPRHPAGRRDGCQQPAAGARRRSTCRPPPPPSGQVPLAAIVHCRDAQRPAAGRASRPVPGGLDVVQPRARRLARRGGRADRGGGARHRPAGQLHHRATRARCQRSRRRCRTSCC